MRSACAGYTRSQAEEIARCRIEVAEAEAALRAGEEPVMGRCLQLSDWASEKRILEVRNAANA